MIHFLDPFSKVNLLRRLFTNYITQIVFFLNSFVLMLDYKYDYLNIYLKPNWMVNLLKGGMN